MDTTSSTSPDGPLSEPQRPASVTRCLSHWLGQQRSARSDEARDPWCDTVPAVWLETRPPDSTHETWSLENLMARSEDRMNLACPHCGREFAKSLDRLRSEPIVTCPGCRAPTGIDVTDFLKAWELFDDMLTGMEAALTGAGNPTTSMRGLEQIGPGLRTKARRVVPVGQTTVR